MSVIIMVNRWTLRPGGLGGWELFARQILQLTADWFLCVCAELLYIVTYISIMTLCGEHVHNTNVVFPFEDAFCCSEGFTNR